MWSFICCFRYIFFNRSSWCSRKVIYDLGHTGENHCCGSHCLSGNLDGWFLPLQRMLPGYECIFSSQILQDYFTHTWHFYPEGCWSISPTTCSAAEETEGVLERSSCLCAGPTDPHWDPSSVVCSPDGVSPNKGWALMQQALWYNKRKALKYCRWSLLIIIIEDFQNYDDHYNYQGRFMVMMFPPDHERCLSLRLMGCKFLEASFLFPWSILLSQCS